MQLQKPAALPPCREVAPFFVFDHCGFKVQKGHGSTGRVVAWRQVGLRLSYTLEASLCGGDNVCYSRSPTAGLPLLPSPCLSESTVP